MRSNGECFVSSCIHWLTTKTGNRVLMPMGKALHGSEPNEVIHFNFCHISKGEQGHKYVLIIKDDLRSYFWLYPYKEIEAVTVFDALVDCFSAFVVS